MLELKDDSFWAHIDDTNFSIIKGDAEFERDDTGINSTVANNNTVNIPILFVLDMLTKVEHCIYEIGRKNHYYHSLFYILLYLHRYVTDSFTNMGNTLSAWFSYCHYDYLIFL